MKVFSVFMQKGGVGKTTLTFMLAYELAKQGHKTLIIDGDQQGNLTMLSHTMGNFEKEDFLSLLQEKSTVQECVTKIRDDIDFYFIGTKKNDTLFKQYIESSFREEPFIIKHILATIEKEGFEYVFFDLPPSFGFYEKIVLAQVDEIIPIIEPAEAAATGFLQLFKGMKKHTISYDCKYVMNKLIINKTNTQKKVSQYWTEQMKKMPDFTKYEIADSKAIATSTDLHRTIQENNPTNKICLVLKDIAEAIK